MFPYAEATHKRILLPNGASIPALGLGTWKVEGESVKEPVREALRLGIRHIDTAAMYNNEKQIGEVLQEAFKEGVVKREDLWITSKARNSTSVSRTLQQSLENLQVSYLDLYLVHLPDSKPGPGINPPLIKTWREMEDMYDKGLAKSIGVSNFSRKKLQGILNQCRIKPHVHQFELHPLFRNDELEKFTKDQGIHVMAYSPLGSPDSAAMMGRDPDNPTPLKLKEVHEVASRVTKTPAQVLIRYALQRGASVIPKSANPEHIKENLDVFGWDLSDQDMLKLNSIEPQVRKCHLALLLNPEGPYKELKDLWDE